ncbi:hypothetical protein INR49_000771 [Caranx melampygus]|nr:hypothetical protein INR49_000771 [Caranx melampygus]
MSFRRGVVRQSKFRHVFAQAWKAEHCIDDVRGVPRYVGQSPVCSQPPKFIAVIIEAGGGGAFLVVPISKVAGSISPVPRVWPCGAGLDIQWSPHDDSIIASARRTAQSQRGPHKSNDRAIVPLRATVKEWESWLGTQCLQHPPKCRYTLIRCCDNVICVGTWAPLSRVQLSDAHPDLIYSVSWNKDGSALCTVCKDKALRVIDPRRGTVLKVREKVHDGTRPMRAVFLTDGKILTTGFSRMSERQLALWDTKDLSEQWLYKKWIQVLEFSYPFMTLTPTWSTCVERATAHPQGATERSSFLVKEEWNVNKCEIARFYKLHERKVEPISMTVPRKLEPALLADEWIAGQDAPPLLVSLSGGYTAPPSKHRDTLRSKPQARLAGLRDRGGPTCSWQCSSSDIYAYLRHQGGRRRAASSHKRDRWKR